MEQASRLGMVISKRTRFTLAQVNAGATVVAAVAGMAYRIVDVTLIAVGGAAAGGTSVDIIGTRSAATVRPIVAAVAALTVGTAERLQAPPVRAPEAKVPARSSRLRQLLPVKRRG